MLFSSSSDSQHAPSVALDVEQFRIRDIPPAGYYIADFITRDEEEYLLKKVRESPQPKWKTVGTGRRLQYWGGFTTKAGVLLPEALPLFLTSFSNIIERVEGIMKALHHGFKVDQVLVNEYQPDQGIMPHEDGGAFSPSVATLSLGSHTVLDIHHYMSPTTPSPPMIPTGRTIAAVPLAHVLLLPRSLFILSAALYVSHLHGIAPRDEDVIAADPSNGVVVVNASLLADPTVTSGVEGGWRGARGVRTSLTFRQAEKVMKVSLRV